MTDHIDHYAEAEGWLHSEGHAYWPQHALATVHALLAIHDTLTAADRYAANEAKQREAGPDPLDSSRDYDEHERAAEPDPLDEGDHRDRQDADGDRISRRANGLWSYGYEPGLFTLARANELYSPLAFAPDEPQEAASSHEALLCDCGHDIDSHGYDEDRAIYCCGECYPQDCRLLPSAIARVLIDRAVKAERLRLADEWEAL